MPKRRFSSKLLRPTRRYKRRKFAYRKKRNLKYKRMSNPSSLRFRGTFFPDTAYVRLVYTDIVGISWDATPVSGLARYALNSPYDPQVSGGGAYNTQAYGWDQWSAVYANYRCAGSSIQVIGMPGSSASIADQQMRLTVFPTVISSTSATDVQLQRQIPYSKTSIRTFYDSTPIRSYISVRKLAGVTKSTFEGSDGYAAGTSADPTSQHYWMIWANTANEAADAGGANVNVKIVYYVQFFNRKLTSSS